MAIATKSLLTKLEKAATGKKDASALLKDLRWKIVQGKTKNFFSNTLLLVLSQILKEDREVITQEEFSIIKLCAENFESENIGVKDLVVTNVLYYLSDKRPLLDYSSLNSDMRTSLASDGFVETQAKNIVSISAQPIGRLIGTVTVTYNSNNNCRDRDQAQLESLLENFTGFCPHFTSMRTEGVRLYGTVEFLPSQNTFLSCCSDGIDAYLEALDAYRSAGIDVDMEEISAAIVEGLDFSKLNRIDGYSFLNVIKTLELIPADCTVSQRKVNNDNFCACFEGKEDILKDPQFLSQIEQYLYGFRATTFKETLSLKPAGQTLLDRILSERINEFGLEHFINFL